MSKYEPTIKWLKRQRKNAAQAIRDLKSGQKIEFEGTDVTDQWISRYQELVDRYARLISTYEQRDREAELTKSISFKE